MMHHQGRKEIELIRAANPIGIGDAKIRKPGGGVGGAKSRREEDRISLAPNFLNKKGRSQKSGEPTES